MANHVNSNSTIKHSDPAELNKLYELLKSVDEKLISYLLDEEYTEDDIDRTLMTDAIGAKWMEVEELEHHNDEIILIATTAWSHPIEMWENLETKGFSIKANYEDEMPNFFGEYTTEFGDDHVDTTDMWEAIDETVENFESDLKETSDYNNAMFEECVASAVEAVGNVSDFNCETIERLVENYLEMQDHYVGE